VKNLKGRTSKTDLIKLLSQKFDCTSRTIEDIVKDMIKGTGLIALGYCLEKLKISREIYFEPRKVIPTNKQEDIFL
jgi:hypothetical protein